MAPGSPGLAGAWVVSLPPSSRQVRSGFEPEPTRHSGLQNCSGLTSKRVGRDGSRSHSWPLRDTLEQGPAAFFLSSPGASLPRSPPGDILMWHILEPGSAFVFERKIFPSSVYLFCFVFKFYSRSYF